jgi:hypothetical protein
MVYDVADSGFVVRSQGSEFGDRGSGNSVQRRGGSGKREAWSEG